MIFFLQGSGDHSCLKKLHRKHMHGMKYRRISLGLELGTAAVEERLTEIALLMRKTFPLYYWHRREAGERTSALEMHIVVNGHDEQVCFTDRELISYSRKRRRTAIDHRMHDVLARLLDAK